MLRWSVVSLRARRAKGGRGSRRKSLVHVLDPMTCWACDEKASAVLLRNSMNARASRWDWTPRLRRSILGRMSTEILPHSPPSKTSGNPEIAYWTAGKSGPKVMLVMGYYIAEICGSRKSRGSRTPTRFFGMTIVAWGRVRRVLGSHGI